MFYFQYYSEARWFLGKFKLNASSPGCASPSNMSSLDIPFLSRDLITPRRDTRQRSKTGHWWRFKKKKKTYREPTVIKAEHLYPLSDLEPAPLNHRIQFNPVLLPSSDFLSIREIYHGDTPPTRNQRIKFPLHLKCNTSLNQCYLKVTQSFISSFSSLLLHPVSGKQLNNLWICYFFHPECQ